MGHRFVLRAVAACLVAFTASACTKTTTEGLIAPTLVPMTRQNDALRELPPPGKRVTVAVYDFPDLTGQYKERENVQSLSRAVTQGGASMLIKALQDAGERRWFTVLDRADFDDLLRERQIVTEMRRIYRNEERIDPRALPPLRHAGVIMQGAIVGFDTNTRTGGIGARYLGIGGDAQWRQHSVTVTLRAVSTNTGEVLASVTTQKVIASYALQGGLFQYIALDEILELEAGITQNEPRNIAVQQAIEKAVWSLIIEGADLDVWSFADAAAGQELIDSYRNEKFDGEVPLTAMVPPTPDTRNPTNVVETVPRRVRQARAPAVRERVIRRPAPQPPAQPAAATQTTPPPPPPPPPAEGETVG